jgi:hypothetical protein
MGLPVNVDDIQVLRDFRAALCLFGDDARNGLAATEMEISRMLDWLHNDRRLYWDSQIRLRRQDLATAKAELFRKRTSQMFGNEGNLSEPRELVREASKKLETAEAKLARVKKWEQPLQQALMEYRGASGPLSDYVGGELERALALLDRMIRALEDYASGGPPTTETTRSIRADAAAKSVARSLDEPDTGPVVEVELEPAAAATALAEDPSASSAPESQSESESQANPTVSPALPRQD